MRFNVIRDSREWVTAAHPAIAGWRGLGVHHYPAIAGWRGEGMGIEECRVQRVKPEHWEQLKLVEPVDRHALQYWRPWMYLMTPNIVIGNTKRILETHLLHQRKKITQCIKLTFINKFVYNLELQVSGFTYLFHVYILCGCLKIKLPVYLSTLPVILS